MGRSAALGFVVLSALVVTLLSSGCGATVLDERAQAQPVREFSVDIRLEGEPLTLHLALPMTTASASTPLVLYGSGDGGWFGTAVGMFRAIARGGRPTAGFSTRAFMKIEHRRDHPLNVTRLVDAYQHVIGDARRQLGLAADAPVVLAGWSRGAALGVLVASSDESAPGVAGVVAVGLPARENLDLELDSDDDSIAATSGLELYALVRRIAPRRVLVIQASHDGYLSGAQARRLFGEDSDAARLLDIEARNHRFDGAESQLAFALVDGVNWVAAGGPPW
jgi:hypothetical protein